MLKQRAGFAPEENAYVRVTAGRLREALELYAATEGANAPVRIEIPKGGYRPKISYTRQVTDKPQDEPGAANQDASNGPLQAFPFLKEHFRDAKADPELADGLYEVFFPSMSIEGAILVHLMRIERRGNRHVWHSIARIQNPLEGENSSTFLKFEGAFYSIGHRLYSVYSERPHATMVAFLAMESANRLLSGTTGRHTILTGINTAISSDSQRRPIASRVVITSVRNRTNLRALVDNTGYYDPSSTRVNQMVREMLHDEPASNGILSTNPAAVVRSQIQKR